MKVKWFHQVGINLARLYLIRHVPLRTRPDEHFKRHAHHAVGHHLIQAHTKCARSLSIENFPHPVNAIHAQNDQDKLHEKIKAVSGYELEGLASERPEYFHGLCAFTRPRWNSVAAPN